jgi:hypothetical protein
MAPKKKMTSDTRRRTAKSSSSTQTLDSSRRLRLLDLGKIIVRELLLEPGVDTLGRWMAHYLAEKIVAAEEAEDPKTRCLAQTEASELILKIWAHRTGWPKDRRPFQRFDSILDALQSLTPGHNQHRFVRVLGRIPQGAVDEQDGDVQAWLRLGLELEKNARALVDVCLSQAIFAGQ